MKLELRLSTITSRSVPVLSSAAGFASVHPKWITVRHPYIDVFLLETLDPPLVNIRQITAITIMISRLVNL